MFKIGDLVSYTSIIYGITYYGEVKQDSVVKPNGLATTLVYFDKRFKRNFGTCEYQMPNNYIKTCKPLTNQEKISIKITSLWKESNWVKNNPNLLY